MAAPQPGAHTIHHHHHHHHHLRRHLLLIVLTVAAAATRATASASTHTTAASPAPTASSSSSESTSPAAASFLRARCATTLYPALCYDSLLPYASEVQENPARLARIAADVAAARLRALSARVNDILRHGGGGRPSETAAMRDCASTVSAAASLARQSSAELTKLEPDAAGTGTTTSSSSSSSSSAAAWAGGGMSSSSSRQARWEVSNAKTWLSAAMANEGTCADGLVQAGAAAASSPAGKEVTAGVAAVKQYTSNALALVNGIPL